MEYYVKRQNGSAIDDGWSIEDENGYVLAHLDTEHLTDRMLDILLGEPPQGGSYPVDVPILPENCDSKKTDHVFVLTREDIETRVGREVTDEEVQRVKKALGYSILEEVIDGVLDSVLGFKGGDDDA